MKEFVIHMKNKAGQLELVAFALSGYNVNIESLATEVNKEDALIKMITDDADGTRKALEENGIPYKENEILVVNMPNKPGEMAKMAAKLGSEGVDIVSIYLLGEGKFAVRVDNADKAKKAIKEYLT